MQDSDARSWPLLVPGIVLIMLDYAAVLVDAFLRPVEVMGVRFLRNNAKSSDQLPGGVEPFALELRLRK